MNSVIHFVSLIRYITHYDWSRIIVRLEMYTAEEGCQLIQLIYIYIYIYIHTYIFARYINIYDITFYHKWSL